MYIYMYVYICSEYDSGPTKDFVFLFYILECPIFFLFSILNIYTCQNKIYNHQSYIYLMCLGMKKLIMIKIKTKTF